MSVNQPTPTHVFGGSVALANNTFPSSTGTNVTTGGFSPTFILAGTATTITYGSAALATAPAPTTLGAAPVGAEIVVTFGVGNCVVNLPPANEFVGQTLVINFFGLDNAATLKIYKYDGVTQVGSTYTNGSGSAQQGILKVFNGSASGVSATDYTLVVPFVIAST